MSQPASFLKTAFGIIIILLFQINVFPVLSFIPVLPDLFLVLAVAGGIRNPSFFRALAWGFFLGMLKDIFCVRFFGFNSFAFTLDILIIRLFCRRFYRDSLWFNLISLFCAGMFNCLLISFVSGRPYLAIGLSEAALNCLFFPLVRRIHNFAIGNRLSAID